MPFLGKYSSLVSPIVELEDWSIRQLQHLRSHYLLSFSGQGRSDRMNCYLWGGSEWILGTTTTCTFVP